MNKLSMVVVSTGWSPLGQMKRVIGEFKSSVNSFVLGKCINKRICIIVLFLVHGMMFIDSIKHRMLSRGFHI